MIAPNRQEGRDGSQAQHHGDFDDDLATIKATLARIIGAAPRLVPVQLEQPLPERCLEERRKVLKREMNW